MRDNVILWINHGGFGHPAPQDLNCEACRKGLGYEERKLLPMTPQESKDQTTFGFIADQRTR